MIRNVRTVAVLCLVVASATACTSSGSGPSTPGSSADGSGASSPATVTGTAPTAPTSAVVTTCDPSATHLTFAAHRVITAGDQVDIPPHGSVSVGHLDAVTTVRATASGLGTGSGLAGIVRRHWHDLAVPIGRTTRGLQPEGRTTLQNKHGSHNVADVVYVYTHVYTGGFSASCAGGPVSGRYTTFGSFTTVIIDCADTPKRALDRVAKRQFC